jgi:hypothetical protein
VTCPDWNRLLAHRLEGSAEPPADWPSAWAHLQACAACRATASRLDPTVAFRGVAPWSPLAADIEAILSGVRTLRRADRLASTAEDRRRPKRTQARHRAVPAALFAVLLALLPGSTARRGVDTAAPLQRQAPPLAALRVVPAAPALDGLDRPQARVYEWGGDDLSVVMVVDESLDV